MRQVVLDTETTGLDPKQGHRIIEIGCVEIINRRVTRNHYHQYIQPDRESDEGALAVHGISSEFLADKPRFEDIVDDFLTFIKGAELIIHNAPFDVGFIDSELHRLQQQHSRDLGTTCDHATVLDSLLMARKMHPGQKNNLDALCKRYDVNNDKRELHGALLDSEILADVYLAMTGGQSNLLLDSAGADNENTDNSDELIAVKGIETIADQLKLVRASTEETAAHEHYLSNMGEISLWAKPAVTEA
ncbi:MAG: DNA polymerase III subunit epsilon [Gammaproteobacteria bacterium]|nr:DNA polymerase III subunit epsilon [Gammaproteobacteria bacterium]